MRGLLDSDEARWGLRRVAGEIVERHRGADRLLLVGIHRGGVPLAEELARLIRELEAEEGAPGPTVPVGSVDISLYRDDASTALPNPRIGPTRLPISLDGQKVVLVDDVLFTGRTVRAALDALLDYGRPKKVELAVLIERGGRELPVAADYVVKKVDVQPGERVDAIRDESGFRAVAVPFDHPSLAPPPLPTPVEPAP